VAATLVARFAVFVSGAVVALIALASLQELQAASGGTVHTCAGADGKLRMTAANLPCQPEERRVRLQLFDPERPQRKDEDGNVDRLKKRVDDLETRRRLGTLRGRRAYAPFKIVRKSGSGVWPLVTIDEQNVTFYNKNEKPIAWIVADQSGGLLLTQTESGHREATIGAQDKIARVLLTENGQHRIDAGRRNNGRYGMQVYSGGKMVAYVGQSAVGSGFAMINDTAGNQRVSMFVDKGEGHLQVWNTAGKAVGVMSAGTRSGLLQLTDGGGNIMVESGVNPEGAGVVRAGPNFRNFGVGIVGLVPSMIIGKP
jgi:hypothetical protein